jgi:phosphomannomutase/phosphoglucomutase
MKLFPHIFREYDIRGTVDVDLSTDFAYLLGRAYATLAKENKKNQIAVGYDCRLSSPGYADAVCKGLNDEGIDAVLIGMGPTPLAYFSTFVYGFGGAIQITGSHNPPDMNGFKICLGTSTLSGPDIQDLLKRCDRLNGTEAKHKGVGTTSRKNIIEDYSSHIINNIKPHMGNRKLKVVCDAGNGVGGMTGPTILRSLGCEVIELFCEPDGNFPNHHPDPTVLKNIQTLIKTVKETGADIGIGWDGDADRIGAVDEKGNVIFGDMLVLIFGRAILNEDAGATIIGDVKCSKLLFDDINQKGGKAIMWKTGHSLIKAKLKETGGALAGEMSGHIFFKNRFFGFDDAIYASCRLVEILSNTDKKASSLLADLPVMVSTPEIRFDCPEEIKFKVPELAKNAFKDYSVDTTDGARITFEHGWGLIRASNTQPVLVMRFEATTESELKKYESLVNAKLEEIISSLK